MFGTSDRRILCAAGVMLALAAGRAAWLIAQEKPPVPAAAKPAAKGAANFDLPGVEAELLKPFAPVRAPVKVEKQLKGYIDWSGRKVIAVGRSLQVGNRGADKLMAKRAATIIALRNAAALAAGVRIGPDGRVDGLKNGQVMVQALVRGFEAAKVYSEVQGGRTYWIAEVHVPMFGISSVAAKLYDVQLAAHMTLVRGWKRATWAAPAKDADVDGDLLVIDARGTGFGPSMFPVLLDDQGQILMDMQTPGRQAAIRRGLCAYGVTDVKYEKLQSLRGVPRLPLGPKALAAGGPLPWQNVDGVGWDRILLAQAGGAGAKAPASKPASKPRRKRKRFVVRAKQIKDKKSAVLVIGSKEALKMLQSTRASRLAANCRVLIVVDAAAAGMEGRLGPPGSPQRFAAGAR